MGVSLATTIMISSLLKDSSGGFARSIRTNDCENHIQDTNLTIVKQLQRNSFENLEVNMFYSNNGLILVVIIIIMSHRLSARWGQPFTGSDSSILVGLVQGGTVPVHCVDTTLLCHPATLYTDALVEICRPFWQISCV